MYSNCNVPCLTSKYGRFILILCKYFPFPMQISKWSFVFVREQQAEHGGIARGGCALWWQVLGSEKNEKSLLNTKHVDSHCTKYGGKENVRILNLQDNRGSTFRP
jgi:hypothetical protein